MTDPVTRRFAQNPVTRARRPLPEHEVAAPGRRTETGEMPAHRRRTGTIVAAATVLLVGCGAPAQGPPPASSWPASAGPTASPDAASPTTLLDELLAARAQGEPQRFAALVSRAAASCTDADAARTLGQLSAVATRWAESVTSARPKAQARTEAQLSAVAWSELLAACGPL